MKLILSGLIAGIFFCSGTVNAQMIDWEVVNRFRVIKGEEANNRYLSRLFHLRNAGRYQAFIVPDTKGPKKGLSGPQYNFDTFWDERRAQYNIAWVHEKNRDVRIKLDGVKKGSTCLWVRDGNDQSGSSCGERIFKVPLRQTTMFRVDVTHKGQIKKLELPVAPNDTFVAVLGDSTTSGEGNPHLIVDVKANQEDPIAYPAIWWDTRCHRSLVSGGAQAAALLAERNKKASVTYVNYGCSGGEIKDGVLTKAKGRETIPQVRRLWEQAGEPPLQNATLNPNDSEKAATDALTPQIDRLTQIFCPPKAGTQWDVSTTCSDAERRYPDVLLVGVGANDIGFGEIARDLLLSGPDGSSPAELKKWREQAQQKIEPWFGNLRDDYNELAGKVRDRVKAKKVLLLEYLDPTMYSVAKGQHRVCGAAMSRSETFTDQFEDKVDNEQKMQSFGLNSSLYNILISKGEGDLAKWVVVRLNESVRAAATSTSNPWSAPGQTDFVKLENMTGPDGLRRGFCARNSWFVTIMESWGRQGWIPEDGQNPYALKLQSGQNCAYTVEGDKCMVAAGNITSGILHPNFFGHYNASRQILLKMEEVLAKP